MMEYKGYNAKVDFDDEAMIFHGEVIDLKDVITFQAESVDELKTAFKDSVDDYLEFCEERSEDPEKPFSGNFVVRIEPELHRAVTRHAANEGESVNAYVREVLVHAVSGRVVSQRRAKNSRRGQSGASIVHNKVRGTRSAVVIKRKTATSKKKAGSRKVK